MTPKSITQEARDWLKQDGPVYAGYSPHDAHVQQFVLAFAASLEERYELVERKKCEFGCHLAEPHMRCVDCRPTPQEKPVACEHDYYCACGRPDGTCLAEVFKPQPLVPVEELRQGENSTIPQDMSTVWHKLNEVIRRLNLLANK